MDRRCTKQFLLAWMLMATIGCAFNKMKPAGPSSCPPPSCVDMSAVYQLAPANIACRANSEPARNSLAPRDTASDPTDRLPITLGQAVQAALQQSEIIRDLGGRVMSSPEALASVYDPAIEFYDPNFGVDAALSEFDTNLFSTFNYAKNDRVFNNATLGGGATELQQDLTTLQTGLTKTSMRGTQMSVRANALHDHNNRTGNLFNHVWESQWEMELRKPLLQGAGATFNSIAGPNGQPGLQFGNGVVIAQMNGTISRIDFEIAVRDFVSQVEEAYWRLFQAYKNYESRKATRDAAEEIWKSVRARAAEGMEGGEAYSESQARSQYFFYKDQTIETLNGSDGSIGLYEAERRLRLLMGQAVNDGWLLEPVDEVSQAPMIYEWYSASEKARTQRAEIRRQTWRVKQEELRYLAAKNFTLPRLDALAQYRLRGFGDDLANDGFRFSGALNDMANLDHQEWEFGLQLNVPIGQRRANAGVRHAELRLARERSILRAQELQANHELATAIARSGQTTSSLEAASARVEAARDQVNSLNAAFEADKVPLNLLLDAQERLSEAETRYHQVLVSRAIAEKDIQLAMGSLLNKHGVSLQAGSDQCHYEVVEQTIHETAACESEMYR